MEFEEFKNILSQCVDEIGLNKSVLDVIEEEIQGIDHVPTFELEKLHDKIREKGLSDKIVKQVVLDNISKINQLYGISALTDYYMVFLGFTIPLGGYDWLNNPEDLVKWYQKKIHQTNYGKMALKHKFGSIYEFKVRVSAECQRWLFSKWVFFSDQGLKGSDAESLKEQISQIKNARLIIDINVLKKIFEFNCKDFFYEQEVIDFLSGYDFDIVKFEEQLVNNIKIFGCDYRKRLDDSYELIFT